MWRRARAPRLRDELLLGLRQGARIGAWLGVAVWGSVAAVGWLLDRRGQRRKLS